jgi:hypothetical protein
MTVLRMPPRTSVEPQGPGDDAPPRVDAPVVPIRPTDPGFLALDLSGRLQRALDGALPEGYVTFGAVVLCLPDHEGPPVQAISLPPPVVRGGTDEDLSPLLAGEMRGPLYSALLNSLGEATTLLRSGLRDRLLPMLGQRGPEEGGIR